MSNENHCPAVWSAPVENLVLELPSIAFEGWSLEDEVDAVATQPALGSTVCPDAIFGAMSPTNAAAITSSLRIPTPL